MSFLNRFRLRKKIQWQNAELESEPLARSDPPWPASIPNVAYSHDPVDWIADRFEVFETRVGGMGLVYLCLDHQKDLPVALKTFRPEYLPDRVARDRFLREGTIWVDLGRHSHIVRCFEVFAPGIGPEVYLVLELIAPTEGKEDASLRAWMGRNQPLASRQALLFTLHIVRGMQHATAKKSGMVHRDLKPENILVGRDNIARITDFGLASVLSQLDAPILATVKGEGVLTRTQLTQDFVGTPLYMAPEQWIPGEALDARADIYAVGCILYEMLTAKTAVSGRNLAELEYAHRSGHVREIPPSVPRELANLMHRCIIPDREKRYQTWEQLEAALEKVYRTVVGEDAPVAPSVGAESREERIAAAWSHHVIGSSYVDISKYDAAAKYFEKVIQIGKSEQDQMLEGVGLRNLGMVYIRKGDAMRAIAILKQALAISRRIGWTEEGAVLAQIGNAHRDLGHTQEAVENYSEALAYVRSVGDRTQEGVVANSLGNLYRRLGEIDKAINLYEQALMTVREINDQAGEGLVLNNLGIAYRNSGNPMLAIGFFEQALNIARELGDLAGEGRVLGNLSNAYRQLHDPKRSIEYTLQALRIAQETGTRREEANALGNLGNDYRSMGDVLKATAFYQQALSMSQEIGDIEGTAWTSLNLSVLLATHQQQQDALQHARVAESMYRQVGHAQLAQEAQQMVHRLEREIKVSIHIDRAIAFSNQGHLNDAIREYQSALQLDPEQAGVHYNLGVAYVMTGRIKNAMQEYEIAIHLNPNFTEAHYALGMAYGSQGRMQEAIHELRLAAELGDEPAKKQLARLGFRL